jgi:uncharacterized protein YcnI
METVMMASFFSSSMRARWWSGGLRAGMVGLLGLAAAVAQAHVVLEVPSAVAGSYYKAVLTVGHGCQGQATHTVVVRLPAGFKGAKPMPKPGWSVALRREPLAQPYASHGRQVTEDTAEVTWTAQTPEAPLADAHFDEFVLRGQLPDAAGPLWFKVRQLCAQGQLDWAEVPASGNSTQGLKAPAALLEVLPAQAEHHHH